MRRLAFGLAACFLVAAAAVWFFVPVRYEAYALLKVSAKAPSAGSAEDFAIFKRTQAGLLLSSAVINATLRDAEVAKSETILEHQEDAASFLKSALDISYPDDSEILRVSMHGRHPDDLEHIVNTLVGNYLKEVVQHDAEVRLDHETKLEKTYQQYYTEYEQSLTALNTLEQVQRHGGLRSVQMRQQLAADDLRETLAQRSKINDEIRDTKLQITLAHAAEDLAQGDSAQSETYKAPLAGRLPLPLLEKQQEYLEEQLAQFSKQAQLQTEVMAGLESYSSKVAAKRDELNAMQRTIGELRSELNQTRITRLAPQRVMRLDDAQLVSATGDQFRRNAMTTVTLLAGLGMLGVGLLLPRR